MNSNKKQSILIVVYNRVDLLRRCLLAITQQTILPGEVIISDDGSQENIIDGISDLIPDFNFRLKYIRQADKGFRAAKCRNNAIREAEGDYLVFLDQDILITSGYLNRIYTKRRKGQFLVALPVLLNELQTEQMDEEMIREGSLKQLVTKKQLRRIHKQFFKDKFYYYQRLLFLHGDTRPKVRSGVFGLYKSDLLKVDGFDESYQGWGNEDDDLGRRLYKAGIVGKTVFYNEYPIHLYHPPYRVEKQNINQDYYDKRRLEIKKGKYKPTHGLSNPLGDEKIEIIRLK